MLDIVTIKEAMRFDQGGQAIIMLVLAMTIALVFSLSVATRTITNLRTTSEEESSQRAFSAAEAGIEQSLQNNASSSGTFTNNTTYSSTLATLAGTEFLLNNGAQVLKDDGIDLWLSTYPGFTSPWTGFVTIYWGIAGETCTKSPETNTMPALEVLLIEGSKTNPHVSHYGADPCTGGVPSRVSLNRFSPVSGAGGIIEGRSFIHKMTINVTSGLIMRIIGLYAPVTVGVRGCDNLGANCRSLPVQGKLITSVGTADTTQRKIIGFQENPKLPLEFFPYLLFSPK